MPSQWFYERSGATAGPHTEAEMADLISRARIEMSTPVWNDAQAERKPVVQHPDLARYYPPWAVAELSPEQRGEPPSSSGYAWSPQAKSLKGRQGLLRFALALYMVAQALAVLSIGITTWAFASVTNGVPLEGIAAALVTQISVPIGQVSPFLGFGSYILCVICYSVFIFQAAKNLQISNARGLTTSPSAKVWWSFAPILNLGMIFASMKEIWVVSTNPRTGSGDAPALLGWWWGTFIVGNITSTISDRMFGPGLDDVPMEKLYDAYVAPALVAMAAGAILIVSSFLLIRIVRQVTDAQESLRALTAFDD